MTDDERELSSSLKADADSLVRAADLPSAQHALWRAKVSRFRDRRSRVAHIVTYLHCAAAGLVAAAGTTKVTISNTVATLGSDASSLFSNGGTALMIHAAADDMKTDPAGNAGARIACGVVVK